MRVNVNDYVGIPFVPGGRSKSGCDCWGLVCVVYRDFRIELPDYFGTSVDDASAFERARIDAIGKRQWAQVAYPFRDLDVVLMDRHVTVYRGGKKRVVRAPGHVGVILHGVLLHVEAGVDSVAVPLDHHSVSNRIRGVFRWAG